MHYWSHDCFLTPNRIIDDTAQLRGIPSVESPVKRYDLREDGRACATGAVPTDPFSDHRGFGISVRARSAAPIREADAPSSATRTCAPLRYRPPVRSSPATALAVSR